MIFPMRSWEISSWVGWVRWGRGWTYLVEGEAKNRERLQSQVPHTLVLHTQRVIKSNHDLIVPLVRHGPPQPNLVLSEVAGDVRDEPLDVESLAYDWVS